eukprot:s34_g18.t1
MRAQFALGRSWPLECHLSGPTGGYAKPHQSPAPSAAKPAGTETRPQVLIETKKLQIPDVTNFYQALLHSMNSTKALQPLRLDKEDAQAAIYYGMIWIIHRDPDWAGVPIEMDTGEVCWEAETLSGAWKVTDYLPPAVQGAVRRFAADLLLEPQKMLARRFGLYSDGEKQVADLKIHQAMEVDDKEEQDAQDEERDGDEEMPDAAEKPAEVEEAADTSHMGEREIDQQTAKTLEEPGPRWDRDGSL